MTTIELILLIKEKQKTMTEEQRVEFIEEVEKGYCYLCGRDESSAHCTCWNDE
jgi:hypothetical protein